MPCYMFACWVTKSTNNTSPLVPSLAKIGIAPERWLTITKWPFGYYNLHLKQFIDEAGVIISRLSNHKKEAFEHELRHKIEDSPKRMDPQVH